MLPKPQLNRTAKAAIVELRTQYSIEPTLEEVLWLHELGKAQEAAGHLSGASASPARAGNAWLWPMTIMAAAWLERAMPWFESSDLYETYAIAFALAHGRGQAIPDTARRGWLERIVRNTCDIHETRTLDELMDRADAIRAIQRWASGIQATLPELETAMAWVMPPVHREKAKVTYPEKDTNYTPPGVSDDEVVQQLAVLTGTDPAYWRVRTSRHDTFRAFAAAMAVEMARRGESGPVDESLKTAIQNVRKAVVAIIAAHKPPEEPT